MVINYGEGGGATKREVLQIQKGRLGGGEGGGFSHAEVGGHKRFCGSINMGA